MKTFDRLRSLEIFADFSNEDLHLLDDSMGVERYDDGHTFIRARDRAGEINAMFIVLDGKVLVTTDADGDDQFAMVRLLEPGAIFGLVGLLADGERVANCRAAGPVRVASLTRKVFDRLRESNASWAGQFQLAIARQLARDVRSSNALLAAAMKGSTGHDLRELVPH